MIVLKKIISNFMSYLGLHSLLENIFLSDKAFVLMYHRVLDSKEDQPFFVQRGMFVTSTSFEDQMRFLSERFNVMFLDELVERLVKGEDIRRCCAITFDDGWLDNFTQAFPILEKMKLPATIFLATGFIGTDRLFWPEELCYYLDRLNSAPKVIEGAPVSLLHFTKKISEYQQYGHNFFYDKSIEAFKGFSPAERDEVVGYFREIFAIESLPRQMLNWQEARSMLGSGLIRFGAHTVNHEILDQVSSQVANDEISQSNSEMEKQFGYKTTTFAYPNGNHSKGIGRILGDNSFRAAVTTRKGYFHQATPLMEIPRIGMHEDVSNTIPMFRSRILFRRF